VQGDQPEGFPVDVAFEFVELRFARQHDVGQRRIAVQKRTDRGGDLIDGQPTHGDHVQA
jgi:hypothetical protein